MPEGVYAKPVDRFSKCVSSLLLSNQDYSLSKVSRLCRVDPRTARRYVKLNVDEVNKRIPSEMQVLSKPICICTDGLRVQRRAAV